MVKATQPESEVESAEVDPKEETPSSPQVSSEVKAAVEDQPVLPSPQRDDLPPFQRLVMVQSLSSWRKEIETEDEVTFRNPNGNNLIGRIVSKGAMSFGVLPRDSDRPMEVMAADILAIRRP